MSFLKTLNKAQLDAVKHVEGPVLVLAGAGSGKTKVLTSRIAYLVQNRKVDPSNILAVTFTNKAAQEITERVEKLIGERSSELAAGTFHTIGLRILRQEYGASDKKLSIYDDEEQLLLIRLVMSEMGLSEKDLPSKAVMYEINLAKNDNLGPDEYAKKKGDAFSYAIAKVYTAYQKRLISMNAADFGDLICRPIRMLRSSHEMLTKYREKFRYILVDEYQDTNASQYELTGLLAAGHKNLCVVGDPDQSIYGWRGANIDNILKFQEDYAGAKLIKLEQNYRSTKSILGAANSVIAKNGKRIEKNLWTDNGEGEPVVYEECLNEYQEARFVVNTVRKMMLDDASLKYRDFTVLYRTNTQSRTFEELCFEEGVPYTIIGGYRFFDRREIKDALSYLKAMANPDDSLNFLRIVNVPPRGIGKAALEKVHSIAGRSDLSLYESFKKAVNDNAFPKGEVAGFINTFEKLRTSRKDSGLSEFVSNVLYVTGYMAFWEAKKTEDAEERLKNLEGLVSAVRNYEMSHPKSGLDEYLNLVSLMSDADQRDEKGNRVTFMTIHSAKGLEFPFVFMAGMEEGLFPHKRSVDEDGIEEERRLCYVGMTRARRRLFLLSAKNRSAGKETSTQAPSRFIEEIDPDYLKRKDLVPKGTAQDHIDAIRKLLGS